MLFKLLKSFFVVISQKYFYIKKPLFIGFALTNNCNLHCGYCSIYKMKEQELSYKEISSIIEQLSKKGCLHIAFTGGEPLLRKDISKILDLCKKYKIRTSLSTNGFNSSKILNILKKINYLNLSIDGPPNIHDKIRGNGSFAKLENLLYILKKNKINTTLMVVISKINIKYLPYLLEFADKYNCLIKFQFASKINLTKNNYKLYALSTKQKQEVISFLLKNKNKYKNIANSQNGLKIMRIGKLRNCVAGRIFFRITSNGDILSCWRQQNNDRVSIIKNTLDKALEKITPPKCNCCYLAQGIELSLATDLNIETIWTLLKNKFLK